MKRLFLHIGTHKTGTTSIQYTLARSEPELAKHNAVYPGNYAGQNNPGHHYLAYGEANKRYASLLKQIDQSTQDSVILSTELLSTSPPEQISGLLRRFDAKIICLLRRQDDYLESMYRELCKSSFCKQSSEEYINAVLSDQPLLIFSNFKQTSLRSPLPGDYDKLLGRYAEIVGEENIIAIPYDDPGFGGDAVEKFSRAIDIPLKAAQGGARNVSFSPEVVELRRRLDQHLQDDEKLALRPMFWKLNDALASEQKGESILSTEQRRRILSHYAASNDRVRARFIPDAKVEWLTNPKEAAQSISAKQAKPLEASRAIDLIAQLLKQQTAMNIQATKPSNIAVPKPKGGSRPAQTPGRIDYVGLNFPNVRPLISDARQFRDYSDALMECGLNAIRIPFYWRHLIKYGPDDEVRLNQRLAEVYRTFYAKLPQNTHITGLVVNGHPEIVRLAYLGEPVFAERYAEYVRLLVENFDFIDDIELWNEPNASDFYVSVKGEDGQHRPWNGAEFVDMVIKPGVASLREAGFTGQICGATFAENGLIGHGKRPAFANMLQPFRAEFETEFADNDERGRFYFQPDFARDVLQVLKSEYPTAESLPFDAFGVHPYPYFGPSPDGFAAHSRNLTEEFCDLLEEVGYAGMPIWVTEVGARSLDLSMKYDFDAMAQADFVDDFMTYATQEDSIKKVFWYKYRDENWDLKQEKSFGLFDHEGRKKPAYYKFRKRTLRALEAKNMLALQDDFGFGAVMQSSSVDKSFWQTSKSELFTYAIPAQTGTPDGSALLVQPGREIGSSFRIETQKTLARNGTFDLSSGLRFRARKAIGKTQCSDLKLQIFNLADTNSGLFLTARIDLISNFLVLKFGTREGDQKQIANIELEDSRKFHEIAFKSRKQRVHLSFNDDSGKTLFEQNVCTARDALLARRLRGAIEISRAEGEIHFIELSKFYLRRSKDNFEKS